MEYRSEDLPRDGVALLPPSSPETAGLLEDILNRLTNPVAGSAPQAADSEDPCGPTIILCHRSQTAIAAVSWIWRFELDTGGSTRSTESLAQYYDPAEGKRPISGRGKRTWWRLPFTRAICSGKMTLVEAQAQSGRGRKRTGI